jgi:diacylglycerol kinase family enzyme
MEGVIAAIHRFFFLIAAEDYVVHISQYPRDAVWFIRSFAKTFSSQYPIRVYAVGGDGMLFDCLNGVMGFPNMELAVLPYGRINNFIRRFGEKNKALFRDIGRQYLAPAIPLDVIQAGTVYGLNACILGIEALALLNFRRIQKEVEQGGPVVQWVYQKWYKWFLYASSSAAGFNRQYRRRNYAVAIDGEDFSGQYRSIAVANGCDPELPKRPCAGRLHDGMLDIRLEQGPPRTAASPKTLIKQGTNITLGSRIPMLLSLDGILFFESSLAIELLPGAVQFVDAAAGPEYQEGLVEL